MGVAKDVESAEEHLVRMGYASGLRGLVRRFVERSAALQEIALRWAPVMTKTGTSSVEVAVHPDGLFHLEIPAAGSARLTHVWPGWGARHIAVGPAEHLRADALLTVQRGGPFGAPTVAQKVVQLHALHGALRQALGDGSELRALALGHALLGLRVWSDGKIAQRPARAADELARMVESDAEHLSFGSTCMPWIFTDLHPLVGMIRAAPYDLLLCALRVDLAGLLAVTRGELLGVKVGPWEEIRAFDAGPWLAGLVVRPAGAVAKENAPRESARGPGSGGEAPGRPPSGGASVASVGPGGGASGGPSRGGTSTHTAGPTGERATAPASGQDQGEAAAEEKAPKQRKQVATAATTPVRRGRRVRLKPELAAGLTRHVATVEAQIPAKVLGAGFAVELLRALEAAALADHRTLTGKAVELFSRLHKQGYLSVMPGEQAGRAALKLLAELTPLVRRIHYRRWCFAFGDIHEPESELRARIGPVAAE